MQQILRFLKVYLEVFAINQFCYLFLQFFQNFEKVQQFFFAKSGNFAEILQNSNLRKKYKEFNDHHSYKDYEIEEMINESKKLKLQLVCTQKDFIKINEKYKKFIIVVEMNLEFENIKALVRKLNDSLNV